MIYCVQQPKLEDQTLVKIGNTGHRQPILNPAACSQIKSSGLKKKDWLFHFSFPMSFLSTSSGSTQLSLSPERKCGTKIIYFVQSKVASFWTIPNSSKVHCALLILSTDKYRSSVCSGIGKLFHHQCNAIQSLCVSTFGDFCAEVFTFCELLSFDFC